MMPKLFKEMQKLAFREMIPGREQRKTELSIKIHLLGGFPGGAVVENLPANAGDTGSSPGLGRSHMPRSN